MHAALSAARVHSTRVGREGLRSAVRGPAGRTVQPPGGATGLTRAGAVLAVVALVSSVAIPPATYAASTSSQTVFPETITDVDGSTIDVATLAAQGKLVVVTLKATWCPVCQEQLARLRKLLPRLRSCGANFLVLAPGPADELRQIAHDSRFPYPFIEDRDLAIARAADLVLAPDQIAPAIFVLDESRNIAWLQRGRSGVYYGDGELLDRLGCEPLGIA